jgi:hypothetical protein
MTDKANTFWVGMESNSDPGGHGEDFRTYAFVGDGDNQEEVLRKAVLDITNMLNSWHPRLEDGFRIAIRRA